LVGGFRLFWALIFDGERGEVVEGGDEMGRDGGWRREEGRRDGAWGDEDEVADWRRSFIVVLFLLSSHLSGCIFYLLPSIVDLRFWL
jgi:hypothetical protein